MSVYTLIFFYSNGTTDTYTAGSIAQATAIEAGVLRSWYRSAIDLPNHVKIFRLTGMVLINNKYQTVVENTNYIEFYEDLRKEARKNPYIKISFDCSKHKPETYIK